MNKKYDLEKILPHKNPMILIDDILDYSLSDGYLKAIVKIKESSIFYDKTICGISSLVGIEYMAQSIGCYAFFKMGNKQSKVGFLLGTRVYNNSIEKFELGREYKILVKESFFGGDISSFDCLIYNDENEEVISASLNVYQGEGDDIVE